MISRSLRLATLVILLLVLAAVPALVGCGGSETETNVITVGILADFSGAAAFAVVPTVDSFKASIGYYQEKNPIEGVTVNFVSYDHQLNYAKTIQGYQDLKAQGMELLYAMGPTERDMLQSYLSEDHMPCVGSTGRVDTLSFPWIWNTVPTAPWQMESAMQWIAETWDYSKGAPKIGHQGWVLATSEQMQVGIDYMLNHPDYSGKFDWVGSDIATLTNAAWSTSYQKFADCDFVFVTTVGNSLGTFVGQMRAFGYEGAFVTGSDQFAGYWAQVQQNTPAADLYGCYYLWWGPLVGSDSDADWYQEMTAYVKANHSDWATRLKNTGPISGWVTGRITYEAIRSAVEDVGAANVDGDALKAGFDGLEVDLEETGSTFKFSDSNRTGLTKCRLAGWNVDQAKWEVVTEEWYGPLSMPD